MTRHNIVEGEPGIFPQPIAAALRWLARPLRNRAEKQERARGVGGGGAGAEALPEPPPAEGPAPPSPEEQ